MEELSALSPADAEVWKEILSLWESSDDVELNMDVLPDGIIDAGTLAIIVLGFQLNPDGTMKEELIHRLEVAKNSAEKYPDARIVCTGGGTAKENPDATEAGKMAEWLIDQGISPDRILVEDQSRTTAQNAMYTLNLLSEECPQVTRLAIVTSDYHIATGLLLFGAESLLRAGRTGETPYTIVSHAACEARTGTLSPMFQAGALIELSGDEETAWAIYQDHYQIHELP